MAVLSISDFDETKATSGELRDVMPAALIILDINHVLGKCQTARHFTPRPGVNAFLQNLTHLLSQETIDLAFWTSKPRETAEPILKDLVSPMLLDRTLFVWYRDACTPTIIDGNPFHTIKDLEKVWRAFPKYTKKNTYLVDDTPSKCPDHAENLIVAPPYLGPRKAPDDDGLSTILETIKTKIGAPTEATD